MENIGIETEQIEYKKTIGELKEAITSIVAILNKHGSGELYFGVRNNGDVLGQVINDEMYSEMLLARGGEKYSWEKQMSEYTIEDIDMAAFKSYLTKAKAVGRIEFDSDDPVVVLGKLDLFAKDGIHLLNAGAALFCSCTTNDVQMAKFATNVKATFTDIRREDKGSIIGLSKVCEQYIIDAMDWKADIIGLERVETPEIPVEAIREAVINSYGHRLYNNNQCNEIDVFKDRIEIHTTGGFPKGHMPEEFLDGNKTC